MTRYDSEDSLEEDSLERDLRQRERRFAEASAELAKSRYQARSDDGTVSATVNGHNNLLDLQVSPGVLRRSHPATLGHEIVSAVRKARAQAGEVNRARLAEVLDASVEGSTATGRSSTAAEPAVRPRRRPGPRDDDDEDFSQFSYLQ